MDASRRHQSEPQRAYHPLAAAAAVRLGHDTGLGMTSSHFDGCDANLQHQHIAFLLLDSALVVITRLPPIVSSSSHGNGAL